MRIRELMVAATVMSVAACSAEGPEETAEEDEAGEIEGVPVQEVEGADYMVEGVEVQAVDGSDYMAAIDAEPRGMITPEAIG